MTNHLRILCALVLGVAGILACQGIDDGAGTAEGDEGTPAVIRSALTGQVTFRRGVFGSVADSFIDAHDLKRNYGSKDVLRVTPKKEGLIRFDLTSIPAGAVVESAQLTLYLNGDADDDDDCDRHDRRQLPVKFHRIIAPWKESTVTYRSFAQRFDSAVVAQLNATSHDAFKAVNVKPIVQQWVSGEVPNHGFLLATGGKTQVQIVSSDKRVINHRPKLVVTYSTPDDFCRVNPCLNGGTCSNDTAGFACDCAPGFTGTRCEAKVDFCSPNPCENGGACSSSAGGFACVCGEGFAGPTCGTDVDDCAGAPCQNGGICTDGIASYSCTCAPGFTGAGCETNQDDCAPAICQNEGTCIDLVSGYLCQCSAGFSGEHCEIDVDDCVGNLCQNGATCTDGSNSYTCACAPGFLGTRCEINAVDDCIPGRCLNGATCTDVGSDVVCDCAPGYSGNACQIDIDDCATDPCLNNAICVDQVSAFECHCTGGYAGPICAELSPECESGFAACDGECALLSEDGQNCGACGNDCGAGSVCMDGACRDSSIDPGGSPGTGPAMLSTSPAQGLTFGAVRVGATSAQAVTVTNPGGSDLFVSLAVGSPSEFKLVVPPGNLIVPPGGALTFFVVFAPQTTGARSSTLTIQSSSPSNPSHTISLIGGGSVQTVCTFSSECSDVNACTTDVCAGVACTHEPVDCDDGNPCTAEGCDVSTGCGFTPLSGTPCDDGRSTTVNDVCDVGTCRGMVVECPSGYSVLPDGTCACADGTECNGECVALASDQLHCGVCGNACGAGSACVSGACVAPSIVPGGSPGTGPAMLSTFPAQGLAFGAVRVGATSARVVTVTNPGGSDLFVILAVTGSEFLLNVPPGNLIVPPGGSLNFLVVFAPQTTGARSATLTVQSNSLINPSDTLSMTGVGTAADP